MTDIRQPDFTIFAHVYYPKIWEEMVADLDVGIHQVFDLVITRPIGSRPAALPKTSFLRTVREFEVPNRGRDILPFLAALQQHSQLRPGIGLKLHTKRSPHRNDGDGWRRFLMQSLLHADEDGHLSGQTLLTIEPRIGLVAPEAHLLPLSGRTSINQETMVKVLERVAPCAPISALEGSRFPAGSMFWFRHAALRKLIDLDFTDLFASESGQLDGTAAHAFERLFACIVEQEGLISAGMENVEPILRHGRPLSRDELIQLIEATLARDNPFALPLRAFWRRHPALLKCAHSIYTKIPTGAVRLLRRSIGR